MSHKNKIYIPVAMTTLLVVGLFVLHVLRNCSGDEDVYSPKPYSYLRIDLPEHEYEMVSYGPYAFELSKHAILQPIERTDERYWVNIHYPTLNATIHCSYKSVSRNLTALTRDALEFVYKNSQQATAIPEHDFSNPDHRVYGVCFDLEGNTASPLQFFLTDSTSHFFRGAVYCNCRPNADSLAPIHDYLRDDVLNMIETFRWR